MMEEATTINPQCLLLQEREKGSMEVQAEITRELADQSLASPCLPELADYGFRDLMTLDQLEEFQIGNSGSTSAPDLSCSPALAMTEREKITIKQRTTKRKKQSAALLLGISLPQLMLQPQRIYSTLTSSIPNSETVQTLTRFYYGIGSPDALSDFVGAFMGTESFRTPLFVQHMDLAQTVKALEQLESADHITKAYRRLYLSRLCDLRQNRIQYHTNQRKMQHGRSRKERAFKASTVTIT